MDKTEKVARWLYENTPFDDDATQEMADELLDLLDGEPVGRVVGQGHVEWFVQIPPPESLLYLHPPTGSGEREDLKAQIVGLQNQIDFYERSGRKAMERDHRAMEKLRENVVELELVFCYFEGDQLFMVSKEYATRNKLHSYTDPADAILAEGGV